MEIGIVRQRYTPFGGAERFVADALDALSREQVGLTLYTRRWPGGSTAFKPVICDPFFLGNVWRDWGFARCVREKWRALRPDLVQSHERIAGCDIFRAGDGVHRIWLDERTRGMSLIGRASLSLNPYHQYTLAAEARMFADPRLRAVICNSNLVRRQIHSLFGVDESRLHVIYNAVDCVRFSPPSSSDRSAARTHLGVPDDAVVFATVGSGYRRKGVAAALTALAALPASAWLIVAGKERKLGTYQQRAEKAGVAQRVRFLGPVDDVAPVLHAADAFVLPTIYDPLPNACLEAMATGLPTVTSTQCGAAELLLAHDAGLVCDAYDTGALSEAMRSLMDPQRRATMGRRARATVEALTPETMASQLLTLYRTLLAAAPVAAARRSEQPNTDTPKL